MADVPSLVILDTPTPELDCPLCDRRFTQCSIAISSDGAECPFCRGKFPLWVSAPPHGLEVSDQGGNWQIAVSQRTPHAIGLKLFGISAPLLVVGGAVVNLSAKASDDPFSQIQRLVTLLLVALVVSGVGTALNWMFGRNTISGSGSECKADGKSVALDRVNGILLTKAVTDSGEAEAVIRLEGVGFYEDVGRNLSEAQRSWVALFLLKKTAEAACPR